MKRLQCIFWAAILSSCSLGLGVETPSATLTWCHKNIIYKNDSESGRDYWQTPEITLRLREGDCEDFCILFMRILNDVGITSILVLMESSTGSHALVYADSILYDVSGGQVIDEPVKIVQIFTYWETMKIAASYGGSL